MRHPLLAAALLLAAPAAFAGSPDFSLSCATTSTCAQSDFRNVSEDLTAGLHYRSLAPAEATGITGIGVGAYGTYTRVQHEASWKNLTGSDVSAIGMAGIAVHKGLPFNFDVGATYSAIPGTSARLWGAELRYAILPGGIAEPALAVRVAYTGTSGIDQFKYSATSADLSMSKGFAFLTPYIGVGYVRGVADPDASTGLQKETINKSRVFAGARIALLLFEITPEYERTGSNNSYNLRLGFSF
ncbi:MAG TPA: DUF6588 family protein [Stenotrophobium sp.]|jgi:hypothetical protein|nr:DUF6588 family protein [Stenotrophobium sp.]